MMYLQPIATCHIVILQDKKFKLQFLFLLNEREFPPLSNVCQLVLSNVSGSRFYQHKPASHVKLATVHVSPLYDSGVSELIKPLNVSKPVCSSNTTKRNVCNAISISQLIKPLNLSKLVFSSNTTKRNVCNARSVSQLAKLLEVSKTVSSNNATERNVCKVSSASQLVKPLIVSKPVFSSNAFKRK